MRPADLRVPSHDRIGFTAPTIIYDKMRSIDTVAKDLGPKIMTFVADPAFLRAWQAFDAEWTPFFQKYQGESDLPRVGALFFTDDLNRQTESFRDRINAFHADYQRQRQRSGQPVPPPVAPALPRPPEEGPNAPPRAGGTGLPWWFWTLFGVGIVGGGYALYRYYQRAQALKAGIREEILPSLIGPRLAAASARDPELRSRRDHGPTFPRTLEDFANDPRASRSYVYRPYDHPHVLPVGGSERARGRGSYAGDANRSEVARLARALEMRGYTVEPAGDRYGGGPPPLRDSSYDDGYSRDDDGDDDEEGDDGW